ncbi:60S ribosomal protein L3 [Sarcoptes scabiei]|nr:60S ribosomal protein L3 [Sarcoptes scabiei]
MGTCFSRLKQLSQACLPLSDENQNSSSHLFDHEYNQASSSKSSFDFIQDDINDCLIEAEKIFLSVIDIVNLPIELQRLIEIANTDRGWLKILDSMINIIGMNTINGAIENDHIGPTIIILLLEDTPLPTKELIGDLLNLFDNYLTLPIHSPCDVSIIKHRNVCTILAFLAEKMAGTLSTNLLSLKIIKFLEKIIRDNLNHLHVLFALNCIEKFSLTRENKDFIQKHFDIIKELCELEKYLNDFRLETLYTSTTSELLKFQVGFNAQWCLDNVFIKRGRKLSYKKVDYSNLNAILNVNDKTEFLKLSPNGLSARCDTFTFECVRCNYPISEGVYFYEVILLTSGIMQIGWATKLTQFKNHEGSGVGDDRHSIAFDGCRNVIWHNMNHYKHTLGSWVAGDVVGCLIDFNNKKFIFYLNGKKFEITKKIAEKLGLTFSSGPYYAACSLMSYQQCYFNFGQEPFKFPPKKILFKDFDSESKSDSNRSQCEEEFKIIPMHVKLRSCSKSFSFINKRNLCNICYDRSSNIRLKPCNHEVHYFYLQSTQF